MMKLLLAFDVSTSIGSVAVSRGAEILARRFLLRSREHSAQLIPAVAGALEAAGTGRDEVGGVVVGRGPGSFTGVRIAAATARGFARGRGVPLWPRSSLAAAAASEGVVVPPEVGEVDEGSMSSATTGRPVCVLFDARGDRVYAACYRFHGGGPMETLLPPAASTVYEVLASELPPDVVFCGAGALRHRDAFHSAGHTVLPFPAGLPTAEGLLRIHALHPDDPPEPEGSRWEPDYVRGSSAMRPVAAPGAARSAVGTRGTKEGTE